MPHFRIHTYTGNVITAYAVRVSPLGEVEYKPSHDYEGWEYAGANRDIISLTFVP